NPAVKIFAVIIAGVIFVQLVYLIFFSHPSSVPQASVTASVKAGTIEEIGRELFINYVLPFEAAGFLLLAATIGALVLAKKKFE
ncbi:MAG: NADH-quinone oxidoreductase subunit J, partial [Ignavibacteriaceae bacterium]